VDMLHDQHQYTSAIDIIVANTQSRTDLPTVLLRARVYEAAGWCGDAAHWYETASRLSADKDRQVYHEKADRIMAGCDTAGLEKKDVDKFKPIP
jgi:hypothetical protein